MTHDEVVGEIQARAQRRGVLSHYCHDPRRCEGDRGLPDLLLVGPFGAAFVEVKTPGDRFEPEQTTWKHALIAAGQVHRVFGERELMHSGHVNDLLDELAGTA